MIDTIQLDAGTAANDKIARYYRQSDGAAWNTTLNTGAGGWEANDDANYDDYQLAPTAVGQTGRMQITRPAGIGSTLCDLVIIQSVDDTVANDIVVAVASDPSTDQIAAAILVTPSQKIATDAQNRVTTSNPAAASIDNVTITEEDVQVSDA